jgi:ArsR family transcriptional regulator
MCKYIGDGSGEVSNPMEMQDKQFTRIAKALADPRRFEILEVIAGVHEMSCGAIAERFPIGQSTVSHHLKVLADAGLIDVRREGQHGYFTAKPEVLKAYLKELRRRLIFGNAERRTEK